MLSSLILLLACAAAPAQNGPAVDASARGGAYHQFLTGRLLESRGELEAAIEAYRRAATLDPASAEIPAELAALYARQNRAADAIAAAEQALRLDETNAQAHRILGTVHAALAEAATTTEGRTPGAPPRAANDHTAKAIAHLERALSLRPAQADLLLTLGRVYLADGKTDRAVELLADAWAEEPDSPDTALLLSHAYEMAGKHHEAIRTLEQVVEFEPRFYRGLLALADLYERRDRWREAADVYGRASAQQPRSLELMARHARALTHAGDLENAETAARRLMAAAPDDPRGPVALIQTLAARRDHRAVIEAGESALAKLRARGPLAPSATMLLVQLGLAYQETGAFARAIPVLEEARTLSGGSPVAESYLAQALLAAREPQRALDAIRAARANHAGDARLTRLEALALRRLNRATEGIALLERELNEQPDQLDAYVALAEEYAEARRFDAAVTVLERARARFPGDLSIPFQLGSVFERQGRVADAEQAFRTVLAKDPSHAPTLNYLGYMLAERGTRLEEAVTLVRRALDADPHNGAYLDSLGWAYFKLNRLDDAEPLLRRAGEQLVTNSVVQDHLGDVLFARGRVAEAISAWQRALSGDGESVDQAAITRKLEEAKRRSR
jgi:tetratricopeptide (TPR) repeat protein